MGNKIQGIGGRKYGGLPAAGEQIEIVEVYTALC